MSSDIERVIQRDLDQLPLLPAERWVPASPRPASRSSALVRRAAAAIAVLVLAVVLGAALARVRTDNAGRVATTSAPIAAATAPIAAATAPGATGRISRQAALARIYGLSLVNPTITRIEAKLVGRNALQAAGPSIAVANPPSESTWVVAVSGDVRCSYCAAPPVQAFHSGLYLLDARTGDAFATSASPVFWPSGFDALADESIAVNSVTIIARVEEIRSPDLLIVRSEVSPGATRNPVPGANAPVILRADADTAFSWEAGALGGTAFSLDELVRNHQIAPGGSQVRVTFDGELRPDGTYRLESLLTGANTR